MERVEVDLTARNGEMTEALAEAGKTVADTAVSLRKVLRVPSMLQLLALQGGEPVGSRSSGPCYNVWSFPFVAHLGGSGHRVKDEVPRLELVALDFGVVPCLGLLLILGEAGDGSEPRLFGQVEGDGALVIGFGRCDV
ncbi:hypothetical protein GUJ93_ZPchr0012g19146 [Zizania palustris]|uniref:Uncharacterized protein n=1 Tax=Zizania palustris TaxID=103762 RepID=A0A8J5WX37_ZIZPA|nr:hypothetical protein GUJ93_ZPchr0012g19146 [Zizania palustris]